MIDLLLEPMRFLWDFLPLWLVIPLFAFKILITAAYLAHIERLVEDQDGRSTRLAGYDPEDGFRFDPDDFD